MKKTATTTATNAATKAGTKKVTGAAAKDSKTLEVLAGLPLEDGTPWGRKAHTFQWDDARAILDPDAPKRTFTLRGRGMSKTTDIAGLALALLLTEAPNDSVSLVYAADEDQAALTMEALTGFVNRSSLRGRVKLSATSVTNLATRATLTVETSDGASAYGKKPWLTIVDELALWPDTANYRTLWAAIVSALPKVPGSRLVVISTAGSPVGLGARVWAEALESPHWRTSLNPGPAPWWEAADVDATRRSLTDAEWRRLILCEFAEGDESLATVEAVEDALRAGREVLDPDPTRRYVAALDVGTRRDLTAFTIGHAENRADGRHYVIDRVMSWRPTDFGGKVDLAEVEAAVLRECRRYGAKLRFDRMQAEQLTTNLERQGVIVEEYIFSAAGANRLARRLWNVLRDRTLEMPDDQELRDEFMSVRMVETGPSTVKLQNPPGSHDDIVVAVGMVVTDLSDAPAPLNSHIVVPSGSVSRDYAGMAARSGTRTPEPWELARIRRSSQAVGLGLLAELNARAAKGPSVFERG